MSTTRFMLLLPLLVLWYACGDSSSNDDSDSTTALAQNAEDASGLIAVTPDSVWIAKGMPDPGRIWTTEDMRTAYKVLSEENANASGSLLRYDSAHRSAIFARIISEENLSFLKSDSVPLDQRLTMASEFTGAFLPIYMLYAGTLQSGKEYANEVTEMIVALLKVEAELASIAQDFIKTVPNDRRESEQFKSGIRQMQDGIAQSLKGTITILRDQGIFSSAHLEKIALTLKAVSPTLLPFLDEESLNGLRLEAETTLAVTNNPAIKGTLTEVFGIESKTQ